MQPILPRILSAYLSTTARSSLQNVSGTRSLTNISTSFILIDTKHPGNVGSAARGMKTMGFSELILVTPRDDRVLGRKKCIDGASGAVNVLEGAKVFENLEDVLNGDDDIIICGTGMPVSMSNERLPQRYVAPRTFFQEILPLEQQLQSEDKDCSSTEEKHIKIAFLFGNERFGMKPEDMERCDVMLGIPTNPKFGSLNLASAVQIIAYDWREAIGGYDVEI